MIKYVKEHNNGETTVVAVEPARGGDFHVTVNDPRGSPTVSTHNTKSAAKDAAKRWMRNHSKGVEGSNGGGMGGGSLIPGTDSGDGPFGF